MKLLSDIGSFFQCAPLPDTKICGYRIDSRAILPGDLFFAIKGQKVDGHCFLQQVKERGGIAAVVSEDYTGTDFGLFLIRVKDVSEALQLLAKEILTQRAPRIVAVTGSVGKTTTKDFIATLLEDRYRVGKTTGNFNSQLTLPICILNMRGDEEVLVLEMGMSQPGEIARLVAIAPPDISVVTKIGVAHIGAFIDGQDGIAREKGAIFSHDKTKWAIFDHDLTKFTQVYDAIKAKKVSFSLQEISADYVLSVGDALIDERGVRAHRFDLPFKELHILHDFLAAATVARTLGLSWEDIHRKAMHLQVPKMRFEPFEKNGILFINDAYNANPDSMRAALKAFCLLRKEGKKIAVLGSMKELGSFSQNFHEEVGRFAQQYVDTMLVYGKEAKALADAFGEAKKPVEHFLDKKALAERLKSLACPGDTVLFKASRSVELEKVLAHLEIL